MKLTRFTVTIIAILCSIGSAAGEPLEEFGAKIRTAFASQDIRDISKLYDWKNTDQIIRDQKLQDWIRWRSAAKIEKIEFHPIVPNFGWDFHAIVAGEELNGRMYKPDVRPTHILYLTISFDGGSKTTVYFPVVVTGDRVQFPGVAITGEAKG